MSNKGTNLNMMTESEAIEYCQKLITQYTKMEQGLRKEYDALVKIKESFPSRYLEQSTDFEDLMIQSAHWKFEAIKVTRRLAGLSADISIELEFLLSNFKIYISDEALKEKFEKITEGLRDAYVNSKKELKELRKLKENVLNFSDSAEKIIKSFDSDEINFRRLADKKNKFGGTQ